MKNQLYKIIFSVAVILSCGSAMAQTSDGLSKVVEHFSTEWEDGNITTGRSYIIETSLAQADAKSIESDLNLKLKEIVSDRTDGESEAQNIKTKSSLFKSADLIVLSRAYDLANAGSGGKELNKYAYATVQAILKKLSVHKNKDILTSIAQAEFNDTVTSEEKAKIILVSLTNVNTKRSVRFTFVEGTM